MVFTSITWLRFSTVKLLFFPLYYYFVDSFLTLHGLQHPTPGCSPMHAFITQEWTTFSPRSGSDNPCLATPMCGCPPHPLWALTPFAKPFLHTDALSYPALVLTPSLPPSWRPLSFTWVPTSYGRCSPRRWTPSIWARMSHSGSSPCTDTCPCCLDFKLHLLGVWLCTNAGALQGCPSDSDLALTSHSKLPFHTPCSIPLNGMGTELLRQRRKRNKRGRSRALPTLLHPESKATVNPQQDYLDYFKSSTFLKGTFKCHLFMKHFLF